MKKFYLLCLGATFGLCAQSYSMQNCLQGVTSMSISMQVALALRNQMQIVNIGPLPFPAKLASISKGKNQDNGGLLSSIVRTPVSLVMSVGKTIAKAAIGSDLFSEFLEVLQKSDTMSVQDLSNKILSINKQCEGNEDFERKFYSTYYKWLFCSKLNLKDSDAASVDVFKIDIRGKANDPIARLLKDILNSIKRSPQKNAGDWLRFGFFSAFPELLCSPNYFAQISNDKWLSEHLNKFDNIASHVDMFNKLLGLRSLYGEIISQCLNKKIDPMLKIDSIIDFVNTYNPNEISFVCIDASIKQLCLIAMRNNSSWTDARSFADEDMKRIIFFGECYVANVDSFKDDYREHLRLKSIKRSSDIQSPSPFKTYYPFLSMNLTEAVESIDGQKNDIDQFSNILDRLQIEASVSFDEFSATIRSESTEDKDIKALNALLIKAKIDEELLEHFLRIYDIKRAASTALVSTQSFDGSLALNLSPTKMTHAFAAFAIVAQQRLELQDQALIAGAKELDKVKTENQELKQKIDVQEQRIDELHQRIGEKIQEVSEKRFESILYTGKLRNKEFHGNAHIMFKGLDISCAFENGLLDPSKITVNDSINTFKSLIWEWNNLPLINFDMKKLSDFRIVKSDDKNILLLWLATPDQILFIDVETQELSIGSGKMIGNSAQLNGSVGLRIKDRQILKGSFKDNFLRTGGAHLPDGGVMNGSWEGQQNFTGIYVNDQGVAHIYDKEHLGGLPFTGEFVDIYGKKHIYESGQEIIDVSRDEMRSESDRSSEDYSNDETIEGMKAIAMEKK